MMPALSYCASKAQRGYRQAWASLRSSIPIRTSARKDHIPPSQVGNFLRARADGRSSSRIYSKLGQGDLVLFGDRVSFSTGIKNVYYRIDDLSVIDWSISQAGKGLPLNAIFHKLDHQESSDRTKFVLDTKHEDSPTQKIYQYSDIVATGKGVCTEKAIMLQLIAQRNYESYLVSGMITSEGKKEQKHAFNVIIIDGQPYLADLSNPLEINEAEAVVRPCFIPILGLKAVKNNYELVLSPAHVNDRTYSIIDNVNPFEN